MSMSIISAPPLYDNLSNQPSHHADPCLVPSWQNGFGGFPEHSSPVTEMLTPWMNIWLHVHPGDLVTLGVGLESGSLLFWCGLVFGSGHVVLNQNSNTPV